VHDVIDGEAIGSALPLSQLLQRAACLSCFSALPLSQLLQRAASVSAASAALSQLPQRSAAPSAPSDSLLLLLFSLQRKYYKIEGGGVIDGEAIGSALQNADARESRGRLGQCEVST
jgi:hypothetical protein